MGRIDRVLRQLSIRNGTEGSESLKGGVLLSLCTVGCGDVLSCTCFAITIAFIFIRWDGLSQQSLIQESYWKAFYGDCYPEMVKLAWICFRAVESAGVLVHLIASYWTTNQLGADLNSLAAGSFFPDAFYNCAGTQLAELSEDLHWPKLLGAFIEDYRENSNQFSEEDEISNYRAFIYGMFSHQLVDINWHSLSWAQGLLRIAAATEFDGQLELAHNFLDTAGDFFLLNHFLTDNAVGKENPLFEFVSSISYQYPTKHILRVINEKWNVSLSKFQLDYCISQGSIALQTELDSSIHGYPSLISQQFLKVSPIIQDQIMEYHFGGIIDMVSMSKRCLESLDTLLDSDVPFDPWKICDIYRKHSSSDGMGDNSPTQFSYSPVIVSKIATPIFVSPYSASSLFGYSLALGNFLGFRNGACVAVGAPIEEGYGSVYIIPISELLDPSSQEANSMKLDLHRRHLTYSPRFGSHLSTIHIHGLSILVVSTPGLGYIQFYYRNILLLTIHSDHPNVIEGSHGPDNQFGIYTNVYDVNSDNVEDLIILNFLGDSQESPQTGYISIIDGLLLRHLIFRTNKAERSLSLSQCEWKRLSLPLNIKHGNEYAHFGKQVAVHSNLIFASIEAAQCVVCYKSWEPIHIIQRDQISEFSVNSNKRFPSRDGQFGSSFIHITPKIKEISYLLISAHSESIPGCPLCGAVYLYAIDPMIKFLKKLTLNPLAPPSSYSQFGQAIAQDPTDPNIVYISSQHFDNWKGAVWKIELNNVLESPLELFEVIQEPIITGVGNQGSQGFGRSLDLSVHDGRKYLFTGTAFYGINQLKNMQQSLVGGVSICQV